MCWKSQRPVSGRITELPKRVARRFSRSTPLGGKADRTASRLSRARRPAMFPIDGMDAQARAAQALIERLCGAVSLESAWDGEMMRRLVLGARLGPVPNARPSALRCQRLLEFFRMTVYCRNPVNCDHGLRAAVNAEFLQNRRDMRLHRGLRNGEFEGDLLVQ